MDLSNSLFMRAIAQKPVNRPPIWLMRQAGRYLPEYRHTRSQAGDFLSLCKNKELACEVALQPLRRFELDAAILFSDILTVPDAMGLGLSFVAGEGPVFAKPIRDKQTALAMTIPDVANDLDYVFAAARLIRHEMPANIPLIGFSGSPWTLACYMIEGDSSRDFKHAVSFMYQNPQEMHELLSTLACAVSLYLLEQIKAGVNVVMLFDTWGGILSTYHYQEYSLYYMHLIIKQLKELYPDIPVILYTKGGGQWLSQIAGSGCDVVGLDWTVDISFARDTIGDQVSLQGNLDPTVLLTDKHCIRQEVRRILSDYNKNTGLVFNLGHGITPDVLPENVAIMIDAVHEFFS